MVDLIKRIRKPANHVRASVLCQRKITILSIRHINPTEKCNVVITFLLQAFNHNVMLKGLVSCKDFVRLNQFLISNQGYLSCLTINHPAVFPWRFHSAVELLLR